MENKKIFDSLKKQRCGRGSPLQRDSSHKNIELSPTPFQNYIKNKGKKQKNTIPMQFYEYWWFDYLYMYLMTLDQSRWVIHIQKII